MSARVSVESDSLAVQPSYGLYPYQRQVLDDLLEILRPGSRDVVPNSRRVIAHMPTGAGKTRVACHAASSLLNRANAEGKVVVWLASTEELCEQAADDLSRAWQHLGNRPIKIHRYWGSSSLDLYKLEAGFLVAGLPKLWEVSGRDVGLMQGIADVTAGVIFDEAHQAIARTYRYLAEQLLSYQPPLIGLTATPGRSAEIGSPDYELAEMFGYNKVTIDSKGHGNPVKYLIRNDYLADPEFLPVKVSTHVQVSQPKEGFDYTSINLRSLGDINIWQQAIIDTTISALGDHKRVLVFCPSVSSARRCAEAVTNRGMRSEIVLGETPHDQRMASIGRFRSDCSSPIVLFNYGVLTAGFDAPRTRCVIIARPTTSLVLYSQMVGRAMRGRRSGGNRTCRVYTVIDTDLPGFKSVAEAFINWEDLWKQE
ncbi:MAG: DEAD/DEAH box helicase [bacterium]|nr:DEAD/DEAH box helicase [bacterium]